MAKPTNKREAHAASYISELKHILYTRKYKKFLRRQWKRAVRETGKVAAKDGGIYFK